MRINSALETYFRKENMPTDQEITFLAKLFHLERKVVQLWFSNRRLKEKRKISSSDFGREIRYAEILKKRSEKIGSSQNGIELYRFPLQLTGHASSFERFHFGKPNEQTQFRTVIFITTDGGLVQNKFINQIINYIVDVKEKDNFRFQLVDEEDTGYSNFISVYEIHHEKEFRIPCSLTIVVTRYSGDWEEQLFRDQRVDEMFREFMGAKDGIKELDMICNVTVETSETKQPLLSIFGKDVEENLSNLVLSKNFANDKGSWQVVVQHFFAVLATMTTKSLSFTKLVLDERRKMASTLNKLQSLITSTSAKIDEINNTKEITKYLQSQIEKEIQQINCLYLLPNLSASVTRFSSIPQNNCNLSIDSRQWYGCDLYKFYYEAEKKLKDAKSQGLYSVRILQKELFLNGKAVLEHFQLTWRCIQQLNRIALHGNSFLTQRVFDLIYDAEQHLKELGFNEQLENMSKGEN